MTPQTVPIEISGGGSIALDMAGGGAVALELEQVRVVYQNEREPYDGPYTVTPGPEAQTLQTNGKRMTADVVVGAIPNNYGLVTWNGSVLTIS